MNHSKTYIPNGPLFTGSLMLWEAPSPVLGFVHSSSSHSRYPPCPDFTIENIKPEPGNLLCPIPLMPCTTQLLQSFFYLSTSFLSPTLKSQICHCIEKSGKMSSLGTYAGYLNAEVNLCFCDLSNFRDEPEKRYLGWDDI